MESGKTSSITFALVLFVVFSYDHYLLFKRVSADSNLSRKQIAYILSLRSSMVMFILGVLSNIHLHVCKGSLVDYNGSEYLERIQFLGVIYFTSYLIMDIVLGRLYYHEFMCTLSGYTHHIAYTVINLISVWTNVYNVFLLYMFEELPTIILSLGSYNTTLRNNTLFGITFLLTRILYHAFITYKIFKSQIANSYIIIFFATLTLGLHLYWFWGWIKKYGVELARKVFKTKTNKTNENKTKLN